MHSTRRAYIDIAAPVLRQGLGPLLDHGIEIVSSEASDRLGIVRLLVAGDCLPAECETIATDGPCIFSAIPVITIELTQEAYGEQRLVRVTKITAHKAA